MYIYMKALHDHIGNTGMHPASCKMDTPRNDVNFVLLHIVIMHNAIFTRILYNIKYYNIIVISIAQCFVYSVFYFFILVNCIIII